MGEQQKLAFKWVQLFSKTSNKVFDFLMDEFNIFTFNYEY
jgi:hypothetical protein